MKQRLQQKLRSQTGESIAETLVAVLLSSISLLMLAGMIAGSTRLVTRTRSVLDDYYKADNRISSQTGEPEEGTLSVTVSSDSSGTFASETHSNVRYYENTTLGGTPVISYALPTPAPAVTPILDP